MACSKAGNLQRCFDLMTDERDFFDAGGKAVRQGGFSQPLRNVKNVAMGGAVKSRELCIFGDWAYLAQFTSTCTATPLDGGRAFASDPDMPCQFYAREADGICDGGPKTPISGWAE